MGTEDLDRDALLAQAQAIQKAKMSAGPSPTGTPVPSDLLAKAQMIQKAKMSKPSDPSGDAQAALQGFGQGATLGYLPQLQAAAEPLTDKIGDLVTGSNVSADTPDYTTRRDQFSKLQQQLQAAHPKSYLGGQVGGGLTTALAIPGGALAEGTGLAARAGAQVAVGAGMRAAQNPGDTPGQVDPTQLGQRWDNLSDPKSIAIDAAIPLAGPALGAVGGKLGGMAEKTAFKSLGPYARSAMKAFGGDRVNDIGRTMLDTGAVGGIPKSYSSLEKNLSDLKNTAGNNLGSTVENMAQRETGSPISLSRSDIADKMSQDLISPEVDAAGVADRNAKMTSNIENYRRGGLPEDASGPVQDQIPILQAELKKRNVGKEINWDRLPGDDIPDAETFNRNLYNQLRGGVETGGEQLAAKTGFDVDQFKNLKNEYGNLAEAQSIVEKRKAKDFANRLISPSDYGVGLMGAGAGAMIGGSPEEKMKHAALGMALGLANHGARKYGNQIMAPVMNNSGQVMDALSSGANQAARNPIVTQDILNQPGVWNTLYKKDQQK